MMKTMWLSCQKNKTKADAPKKTKTKTLCGKDKKKMTKEQFHLIRAFGTGGFNQLPFKD